MNRRDAGALAATAFLLAAVLCATVSHAAADGLALVATPAVAAAALLGGGRVAAAAAVLASVLALGVTLAEHPPAAALRLAVQVLVFVVVAELARRLAAERRLRASESKWFAMSNALLVEASLDGYFTRLSDEWEICTGWTKEELMARPFREFIHPDDLAATNVHADSLDNHPGEVFNFENRYRAKDGTWRWLLWSARSDEHRKYAVARDITDRKRLEEERLELVGELERMACTDALTGLPNRWSWEPQLAQAIARAERYGHPLALAMVDLDDFKAFNDARGHAAGDVLLAEAAAAWRHTLREGDMLARYGGEEFVAVLEHCSPEEAGVLLERLRASTPGQQTCSVGIAYFEAGDDTTSLVARADHALYEAKRRGRDRLVAAE